MEEIPLVFVTLGAIFLLALAAQEVGRRTRLPRVTMLLLLGFLIGPECLNVLPQGTNSLFQRASEIALTMVGFLLGEQLIHSVRKGNGRAVMILSISAVVVTAVIVFAGLLVFGVSVSAALLLAGIATATDPAATIDVVSQTNAKGKFVDTLLGVVAVDDAWGLLGFSLLMAIAKMTSGNGGEALEPVVEGLWEIGGAFLIGSVLGASLAFFGGRISPKAAIQVEAMGFVFLACGLSIWADVSFILSAMVMGATVAFLAKKRKRPFHSIKNVELPFMILFFTLAGASLDLQALRLLGWMGIAYIVLRCAGRMLGGLWGGKLAGTPIEVRKGMGMALMPQAGVALGMALLAQQEFPEIGNLVMQVAIGSTVFFELLGPILTRRAIFQAIAREEQTSPVDPVENR